MTLSDQIGLLLFALVIVALLLDLIDDRED
jgi:hypothetical protein